MNCKHCGTEIDAKHSMIGDTLLERGECNMCHHFVTAVEHNPGNTLIINGEMYTVGNEQESPSWFRGCGGALHFFEFFNSDIAYKSTNIWHRGTVPAHFRQIMADNACWVSWDNWKVGLDKAINLC